MISRLASSHYRDARPRRGKLSGCPIAALGPLRHGAGRISAHQALGVAPHAAANAPLAPYEAIGAREAMTRGTDRSGGRIPVARRLRAGILFDDHNSILLGSDLEDCGTKKGPAQHSAAAPGPRVPWRSPSGLAVGAWPERSAPCSSAHPRPRRGSRWLPSRVRP